MKRETKETSVEVTLDLEGQGVRDVRKSIDTGVALLDFILSNLASSSAFGLEVRAKGDLETGDHHTTEDVGITLGCVIAKLVSRGMGSSIVPAGDCIATAAVRFDEPGYRGDFNFQAEEIGGMSLENFSHFLRALAYNGGFSLYMKAEGDDDRRKIEAMAIALGRALIRAAGDGLEK